MINEDVLNERRRCEQIILNAIKRNADKPALADKLRLILRKIRTGASGGPSSEPQAKP